MAEVRGTQGMSIELVGLAELQRQFEDIANLPKSSLTKAAKAGMNPIVADAKARGSAFTKSGMMVRGIKGVQEKSKKARGKKSVYRVNWWAKYSDTYKRKIENAGIYGGKRNPAYYPQSVEWGFPNKHGKVAGKYFVRAAIEAHQAQSLQKVIDTMMEEIDKQTH
jgi:hypothetical protein